jgi:transcriptional regulator with XRE-family HTH domain
MPKYQYPWLPKKPRVNIALRLKQWRKREGLTQKKAVEVLKNWSLKGYQELEQGRRGQGLPDYRYNYLIEHTKAPPRKTKKTEKKKP